MRLLLIEVFVTSVGVNGELQAELHVTFILDIQVGFGFRMPIWAQSLSKVEV